MVDTPTLSKFKMGKMMQIIKKKKKKELIFPFFHTPFAAMLGKHTFVKLQMLNSNFSWGNLTNSSCINSKGWLCKCHQK